MIKMTLEVPEAQFQALRDSLKSKFVRPALAAAINAELGKMKTQCKREAAKILNVPQEKEIAPRLSVRDATEAMLSGSVIVKRLPIPLSRFKPRQTSTHRRGAGFGL